MVADVETGIAALCLDLGDRFAHETLADQAVGQNGADRNRHIAVDHRLVVVALAFFDQKIGFGEGLVHTVDFHVEVFAAAECCDCGGSVGGCEQFAHQIDVFAEAAAERPQLRFQVVYDQIGKIVRQRDFLDVQFVRDQRAEFVGKLRTGDQHFSKRLADLQVRRVAQRASVRDDLQDRFHLFLDLGIDERGVAHGEIRQMHAFRSVRIDGADQILIDGFRHERRERRSQKRHRFQDSEERIERVGLVLRHFTRPVALSSSADVPVGQLLRKVAHLSGGLRDAVVRQIVVDGGDQRVQFGQDPAVKKTGILGKSQLRGVDPVDIRIEDIERVGIPQRGHVLALRLAHGFRREPVRQPGGGGDIEIPAHGVGALDIQDLGRRDDIAKMLAHLFAFAVVDMSQHDAVAERSAVEDGRGDRQQGVEPSAGLIHRLADEIRGVTAFELFLVLKGVMPLREGHGAGVVPAVDDLGHALHVFSALGADQMDVVDKRLVQLDVIRHVASELFQFGDAADHMLVSAGAFPDGKRGAPVTVAGKSPVDDVLKEIAHASGPDRFRDPVDGGVVFQKLVAQRGHADEPRGARVVQKRRVTAPAERIIVLIGQRGEQKTSFLQVGDDLRIRVLDEFSRGDFALGGETALQIDQAQKRQVVVFAYAGVVFTESGSVVYDACAVFQCDIGIADDSVAACAVRFCPVIQRFVGNADIFAAELAVHDLVGAFTQNIVQKRFGEDQVLTLPQDLRVGHVRVHAQADVGGKRPGRRGPGEDVGVLFSQDLEADGDGGLLDPLVALRDLMAGQRRPAARAVRHDFVAVIDQAFVPERLQRPPFRLDVVVVIGDVGIFHVGPVTDAVRHDLPLGEVFPDAFLALPDERLDPVGFDLRFSVDAQKVLHFQFDRQAVRVPAGFAQHIVALHRVVARNDVLERTGQDMADMRFSVGGRRTVIKGKGLSAFAKRDALLEDVVFLPEGKDFRFAVDELHVGGDFFVHRSTPFSDLKQKRKTPFLPVTGRKSELLRGTTHSSRIETCSFSV